MSGGYIAKAARTDWLTPGEVVDVVEEAFGGRVDLDPCGNKRSLVGARHQYLLPHKDGLHSPWMGKVFVNPPFDNVGDWLEKAWIESQVDRPRGQAYECIFLMPSRTDTRSWQAYAATAKAICFWAGRITFHGAPASAPFPTAFLYWGPGEGMDRFMMAFSVYGMITRVVDFGMKLA